MEHTYQHGSPTIIGGMELSEKVFNDIIAYFNAYVADAIAAYYGNGRYGLLAKPQGGEGIHFEIREDRMVILHCFAISPTGNVMIVNDPHELEDRLSGLDKNHTYRLAIKGAFVPQIQYGSLAEGLPDRKVYSRPDYHFHFVDTIALQNRPVRTNTLDVAEFEYQNGEWAPTSFMPLCCQLGALEKLNSLKSTYAESMDKLIDLFASIAHRAIAQQSRAEELLRTLCIEAGSTLSRYRNKYKGLTELDHPEALFEPWLALAGNLRFLSDMMEKNTYSRVFDLVGANTRNTLAAKYDSFAAFSHLIKPMQYESFSTKELNERVYNTTTFIEELNLLFGVLQNFSHLPQDVPDLNRSKDFEGQF